MDDMVLNADVLDVDEIFEQNYAKAFAEHGIDDVVKQEKLKMLAQIAQELSDLSIDEVFRNLLGLVAKGSCECGNNSCCKANNTSCRCV